tara:strand:- start:262 stop:588 length:327 start_codon:yes stop_codon:yes gene_type:complete
MAIKTIEQFRTEAQANIDAVKVSNGGDGYWTQTSGNRVEFSDSQYATQVEDDAQRALDQQDNGYKRARQEAYASLAEQLDMQYWDSVNETTTWNEHVAQVKADNPKPS